MAFYFRKDVKSSSEYFTYSIPVMIAEIGGYMGLLLGISLFDLSLGIDFILDSFYIRNRKIASDEKITTVRPMDDKWMTNGRTIKRPFGLRTMLQCTDMQDAKIFAKTLHLYFLQEMMKKKSQLSYHVRVIQHLSRSHFPTGLILLVLFLKDYSMSRHWGEI